MTRSKVRIGMIAVATAALAVIAVLVATGSGSGPQVHAANVDNSLTIPGAVVTVPAADAFQPKVEQTVAVTEAVDAASRVRLASVLGSASVPPSASADVVGASNGTAVLLVASESGSCIAFGSPARGGLDLGHIACPGAGMSFLAASAPYYDNSTFLIDVSGVQPSRVVRLFGYAPTASSVDLVGSSDETLVSAPVTEGVYLLPVDQNAASSRGATQVVGRSAGGSILWRKLIVGAKPA